MANFFPVTSKISRILWKWRINDPKVRHFDKRPNIPRIIKMANFRWTKLSKWRTVSRFWVAEFYIDFQCKESGINIYNLSPLQTVSNIRHQNWRDPRVFLDPSLCWISRWVLIEAYRTVPTIPWRRYGTCSDLFRNFFASPKSIKNNWLWSAPPIKILSGWKNVCTTSGDFCLGQNAHLKI